MRSITAMFLVLDQKSLAQKLTEKMRNYSPNWHPIKNTHTFSKIHDLCFLFIENTIVYQSLISCL